MRKETNKRTNQISTDSYEIFSDNTMLLMQTCKFSNSFNKDNCIKINNIFNKDNDKINSLNEKIKERNKDNNNEESSSLNCFSNYRTINHNNLDSFGKKTSFFTNIYYSKFTHSYALPVIYFIASIFTLFILIMFNFYEENYLSFRLKNFNNFKREKQIFSSFYLFPNFYKLKKIQPIVFSIGISLLSFTGLLNVWFYCSMLLQRFSVPEFRNNKILIHFMFIMGITANILILFFGFFPIILNFDSIKIKEIKISLIAIFFLIFIFLNIIFAVIGLKSLEFLKKQIECDDQSFSKKLNAKKIIIYLDLIIILIYIISIFIKQSEDKNKNIFSSDKFSKYKKVEKFINDFIPYFFPYILFILNAFLNLGFYSDLIYLQKKLSTIIDKEYFIANDEYYSLIT